jgi:hypothetical protein
MPRTALLEMLKQELLAPRVQRLELGNVLAIAIDVGD